MGKNKKNKDKFQPINRGKIFDRLLKEREVTIDDPRFDCVIKPTINRTDPETGKVEVFLEENDTGSLFGPPKSGKSNLTYSMVTGIKNPKSKYTLGFGSCLPKDALVLLFNTEEKGRRVKRRLKKLSKMVTGDEDKKIKNLMQFYLKGLTGVDILDFVGHTLLKYPEARFGILDHYGDCILSYSDETSARETTTMIDNTMNDNPEFTYLLPFHSNRTGGATNGVAGSFLDKKTSAQLQLEANPNPDKDPDLYFTNVHMNLTRNGYFSPFTFGETKKGLPKLIEI